MRGRTVSRPRSLSSARLSARCTSSAVNGFIRHPSARSGIGKLGEPITLYGDGSQTRSFCYVDDLVAGLIALMETGPKITGPINIGNPNEFTVRELAEQVIRLTNANSEIIEAPLPQDDPKQRQPDITKAKRDLKWEPSVQLEQGLVKTIDYFRRFV